MLQLHKRLVSIADELDARLVSQQAACSHVKVGTAKASRCATELDALEERWGSYDSERKTYERALKEAIGRVPLPEDAAELVAILDSAAKDLELPKGRATGRSLTQENCNKFFLQIGQELQKRNRPSWSGDFPDNPKRPEKWTANMVVRRISESAGRGGDGKWQMIGLSGNELGPSIEEIYTQAQQLANRGVIIVGAMPGGTNSHGHLGILAPLPCGFESKSVSGSAGPFVRDGDEHETRDKSRKYCPSTYGTVRASEAFRLSTTDWYIWTASRR